jgi:hypothetical protein
MKVHAWMVIVSVMMAALTVPVLHASANQSQPCGRRVVYDGALNSLPDAQRMTYVAVGVGASQTLTQGGAILDTLSANRIYAGYSIDAANPPVLDRTSGYTLTLDLAVLDEVHNNPNRAGFNVIVLSNDKLGIELGFWSNEVWAQNGPPALFTRAESVAVNTSISQRYALAVQGDRYMLSAGGDVLLSGLLRDYTSFEGSIDPYETPNFTFMGDNSTTSRARVKLSFVALTFKPCTARLPITTRAP